ncbi:MAG: asparagine synthase (glutamine-hydrolyzing) [Planctomycetota bacterium]|jgi:asparagine synthase (glutamine-hydrolysing)
MCGITGWAARPGGPLPDRATLERMTEAMRHRGPDGDGYHLEQGVGLGHRRLSIIDVAGGDNPLYDEGRRLALVFNGEIYNHEALRAELEADGARPRTRSDGEVILHGYRAWGLAGMLARLRGMYAFALHDLDSGALHLARDPFGIKPLHVHVGPTGLLFGSEPKSLIAGLGRRPALSPRGLLQSVCLGFTLNPLTVHEGIECLAPGSSVTWRDGRLERARHHELAWEPGRESDEPEALWERLTRSVSSHLMSEVPLGAFLSGGLDSSTVVAAMAAACAGTGTGSTDAISVGVLEAGMDERPFAREVAAALGVRLHEETADPGLLDLLPRLAQHLDGPFADTSVAPTWLVCAAARRHVTVALSGDGGDENFAGYRRTRFDVLEARWRARLPGALRRGLLGPLGRHWPRGPWVPGPLRAGTLLTNLADDWLGAYVRSMARIPEAQARRLLRPELLTDAPLRADFEGHAARCEHLDPLHRVLAMDFSTWLTDDILVKVDRMSMAHGLEVRVPLLDTDFVGWAAGLPGRARLAGGRGKVLLRRAAAGHLPASVLERPKQGFHLPVARWLRGDLGDRLDAILAEDRGPAFDVLVHHRMLRLASEHRAERADRSTELWFLLVLDAFLRHGADGTA